MTVFEITSVVGLFIGPIASAAIAVMLTDRSHKRDVVTARKLDIFRTLMRTRRAQLDPAFVGALNLVEVDFDDSEDVKGRFRDLLNSYSMTLPKMNAEEILSSDTDEMKANKNSAYSQRTYEDRQEKVIRLINSMALNLGYKIDQLDVLKRSYLPQKFTDVEQEQEIMRRFVMDLARGTAKLPIAVSLPAGAGALVGS